MASYLLRRLLSLLLLATQLAPFVLIDEVSRVWGTGAQGAGEALLQVGSIVWAVVGWAAFAYAGKRTISDENEQGEKFIGLAVAAMPVLFVVSLGFWPLLLLYFCWEED